MSDRGRGVERYVMRLVSEAYDAGLALGVDELEA